VTGRVTAVDIRLELRVLAANSTTHTVEVVLDTGFEGELALPRSVLATFGAASRGAAGFNLADGTPVMGGLYSLVIEWDGLPRVVEAIDIASEPLAGLELIRNHRLEADIVVGGSGDHHDTADSLSRPGALAAAR